MVYLIVLLVVAQRLLELVIAQRNTRRLLNSGAREYFPKHYPLFILLHSFWLLTIFMQVNSATPVNGFLLSVFVLLQLGRVWILKTLGGYWTTRIISADNFPLIKEGPYRYFSHPNYLLVVAEIFVLPMVFGLWQVALWFSIFNALLLNYRLRCENQVLSERV